MGYHYEFTPLLPEGKNWFSDYIFTEPFAVYKNTNKQYVFSANMAAKLLMSLIKPIFRYDPDNKVWFEFDGTRWVKTHRLFTVISDNLDHIKSKCQFSDDKMTAVVGLNKIHNDRLKPNVIEILQKESAMHADLQAFDADPDLLNTPDGIYNLLTLEKRPNCADDLCKQITNVAPEDDDDGKNCPNYIRHLEFMTNGDKLLQEYLELISGYILTGHTFLQEFYWFYGTQNNGKSSLAGIWFFILGDYAHIAPQGQFAYNYYDPHPEQLLRLAGKRLVLIEELKGNRWDESKLKSVMSGNPIAAREMHGKTVNFIPTSKLLFTSNHQPAIDPGDGGITRRLKLISFINQITPTMRIVDFDKTILRVEAPFILNRMMRYGQKVLLARKIETPNYVSLESHQYLQANDIVQQFIEDGCSTGNAYQDSTKNLYLAFSLWCGDNGYDLLSNKRFCDQLKRLGFKSYKNDIIRGYRGIQVNEIYKVKIR